MRTGRRSAITAGVLIIIGTVAGLLSVVPSVDEPDYLKKVSENKGQTPTSPARSATGSPKRTRGRMTS